MTRAHARQRGQAGIELLLALAGFFALLAFLLPAITETQKGTLALGEVASAASFLERLDARACEARFFAAGTAFLERAYAPSTWEVTLSGSVLEARTGARTVRRKARCLNGAAKLEGQGRIAWYVVRDEKGGLTLDDHAHLAGE